VPYYASHRDFFEVPGNGRLRLYERFEDITMEAKACLQDADLAMTTSYCPDARAATELLLNANTGIRAFYDLDTPITLETLRSGTIPSYIPEQGLGDFDLVLSYTGGQALTELQNKLSAKRVAPLFGSVDPDLHFPVLPVESYRSDLSYLGTYSTDRQARLDELFVEAARRMPNSRFVIGGAQYPDVFPWKENIYFLRHLPPKLHRDFFCSSRATLNVTRRAMAAYGYCPSGRLFEAAACGVPILSDCWEGLELFFSPGNELLVVNTADDVVTALQLTDTELAKISKTARERTLAEHTAEQRAIELELLCSNIEPNASAA